MNELELILLRLMAKIMVRFPDGLERIRAAVRAIEAAGPGRCVELDNATTLH
jgi:hypothetical protein